MLDPALLLDVHQLLGAAEARVDPYPLFARLRASAPVLRALSGTWLAAGYEEVREVLCSRDFGVDLWADPGRTAFGPTRRTDHRYRMMSFRDPPEHTRLRAIVARSFAAREAERHRVTVARTVREMLGRGDRLDLVADLAVDLPVNVTCALLEIPPSETPAVRHWTACLTRHLGQMASEPDDDLLAEQEAFARYVDDLVRDLPSGDGPLAALRSAFRAGQLDAIQLAAYVMLLLVSGRETVTHLAGCAVVSLLRHADQLQRLQAEPEWLANSVEESLRFESPVRIVARIALRDTQLGGHTLERGATVLAIVGSANRDEKVFRDPDRFDIARDTRANLGFGAGAHFCLGAGLGRIEIQEVLRALFLEHRRVVPRFDPASVGWVTSLLFRGPAALPVELVS